MDRSHVKRYREVNETAELEFVDGSCLSLVPYRNIKNWGTIVGFDSALLVRDGTIMALVAVSSSRYLIPEKRGFWSRYHLTQQELAGYLTAAAEVGTQLNNDYDLGKITEKMWISQFMEFCRITSDSELLKLRKSLEEGKERVLSFLPRGYER